MDREGETSCTRERDPYQPLEEDRNEERSWEQRFRDIQQEISHIKVAVKGRAPEQRSISTVKKPSCPSKEALLLKRKGAGATKKEKEPPRDRQTGTDPQGGVEKTESGPR